MRSRRVIDATGHDGPISSAPGGIHVAGQRVPLEEVAVLMLGNSSTISGGALSMLARYGVVTLNCDWRGVPDLVAYGCSENSRVARRHCAQAELSRPRRKAAWQAIVRAKIHGQERNLEAIGDRTSAERLEVLRKGVRSGDPSNYEAQAARIYWGAFLDEQGFRRRPDGEDRVNALLNYGYAVIRGIVIQAILASGLWPSYGLFHKHRANTAALADDLIEPFRPVVDFRVSRLGPDAALDNRDVKQCLVALLSEPMGLTGTTVASSIHDLAAALAQYYEGAEPQLSVPTWMPPSPGTSPWSLHRTRNYDG